MPTIDAKDVETFREVFPRLPLMWILKEVAQRVHFTAEMAMVTDRIDGIWAGAFRGLTNEEINQLKKMGDTFLVK